MIRAAALAMMLSGAPALACSPAFVEPSPHPRQGPDCTFGIDLNQVDAVHLGPATRLGGGLVVQVLSEGNGCYSRSHLVVHDCPARRVMMIGPEDFSLMEAMGEDVDEPALAQIRAAALAASAAGRPMTPAEFEAMGRDRGFEAPRVLRTTDSLRYGPQTVPLACACREAAG